MATRRSASLDGAVFGAAGAPVANGSSGTCVMCEAYTGFGVEVQSFNKASKVKRQQKRLPRKPF
jgi:hypothetical protein